MHISYEMGSSAFSHLSPAVASPASRRSFVVKDGRSKLASMTGRFDMFFFSFLKYFDVMWNIYASHTHGRDELVFFSYIYFSIHHRRMCYNMTVVMMT